MKKIYFMLLLISAYNAPSQIRVTDGSIVRYSVPLNMSKDESVEGNPLLFEDWRFGKVILKNNEQYDYVRLNFDATNNKFYFNQHDSSFELLSLVDEIRVKDTFHPTDSTYDMVFKNNINGGVVVKPENFVQVLCNGKITIVKQYTKRIEGENFTNGISKSVKKYVLHTNILAIVNDKVIPVKLNSHFFEELTSDKQDQMKAFLKSKELNLKKEPDFKKAILYYNSISSS